MKNTPLLLAALAMLVLPSCTAVVDPNARVAVGYPYWGAPYRTVPVYRGHPSGHHHHNHVSYAPGHARYAPPASYYRSSSPVPKWKKPHPHAGTRVRVDGNLLPVRIGSRTTLGF